MQHTHCFSTALGSMVIAIAEKFGPGAPFHLQKDLNLTNNQYNNFQKLKYWGLVEKVYVDGKREGGYWRFTDKATDLLNGGSVSRQVTTFNNEVQSRSQEMVRLSETTGNYDLPEVWARRARPIQQQAQPQPSLFGVGAGQTFRNQGHRDPA
jgi:hypothetical protein